MVRSQMRGLSAVAHVLAGVSVREVVGHGVVLGVVLQLLGRDGRAEEVLQVLEHVLLGGRERARLRVVVEVGHAGTAETFLLGYGREVAHRLAERERPCLPNVVTRFAYGF